MSRFFNRIGKMVTKRYKLVIVIWLLALLAAVPFAPLANNAVVYSETNDPGISDQPSVLAGEWISQHFTSSSGHTIIIVLTADNITGSGAKSAITSISNKLNQASPLHGGKLTGNATLQTVYSVTTSYSRSFLMQVNYEYYYLDNVTEYLQTLLFGIPELHLSAWQQVNATVDPATPVWQKDLLANQAATTAISGIIVNYTFLSDAQRAVIWAYDAAYDKAWTGTANDTVLVDRPTYRMYDATEAGYSSFINGTEVRSLNQFSQDILGKVKSSFDFTTAFNRTLIDRFSLEQISKRSETEPWLVATAVLYGPVSVNGTVDLAVALRISALASNIAGNCSLSSFPLPLVPATISTFVNAPQNDTMLLLLTLDDDKGTVGVSDSDLSIIRGILNDVTSSSSGMHYYVTGNDVINSDMSDSVNQDVARIDPVTIILVLVLIGLFFRSPIASSIPPAIIGIALGMSYAAVYLVGMYVMDVNYTVLTLIITVTLGAGCDYCIFLISRYREERRKGAAKGEAVEAAVTWAGEAIATSGATVIVGFGALAMGHLQVIKSMSILAFSILMALLIALTFLPSIIMLIGDRIVWPDRMTKVRRPSAYFTRSAHFAIKHAKVITLAAILISVPATYVVLTSTTSYDYIAAMPDTESKQGLDALVAGFGGGTIDPTTVGVSLTVSIINSTGDFDLRAMDAIEELSQAYTALPNVKLVDGPTRPYGEVIDYRNLSSDTSITAQLYEQYIKQSMVGNDNHSVLLTIVFDEEPFSAASIDSIHAIRQASDRVVEEGGVIDGIYVSGATARTYDISSMTQQDLYMIISLVIGIIFIILMLVLRSVISPLKSILTILLSISWTLAVTLLFFQHAMATPVMWMVPMVLIVVCLGLGMDYDILLITRIREEVRKGKTNDEAIVHGLESTGGIITACGVIMAGAFGSMMLSNGALLREFGFALMFAILLDATIVRIYLVPAIMALMGKWNWWAPGRLQDPLLKDEKKD